MAKVICTRPNASTEINGVKFAPHPSIKGAMLSEDVTDEQAEGFARIEGYSIDGKAPEVTDTGAGGGTGAGGEGAALMTAEELRAAELKKMTVKALTALAKDMSITPVRGWKEADFIGAIMAAEKGAADAAAKLAEGKQGGGEGSGTEGAGAGGSDLGAGTGGGEGAGTPAAASGAGAGTNNDPEVF